MRSIEDLASEENARLWEERGQNFKSLLWLSGIALGPLGWFLFTKDQMGQGSVFVLGSFLLLLLAGGLLRNARFSAPAFVIALGIFLFGDTVFYFSRVPTFFWGKDPSFWIAVQEGMVVEPFWSPLSYLVGQAGVFIGHGDMGLLPLLSAFFLALGLGLWAYEAFLRFPNQTFRIWSLTLLSGMVLAVTLPFWHLGTLASGLPATLGFFVFGLLSCLTQRDERPWFSILLLWGLLFSVHPLWGALGTITLWTQREVSRVPIWKRAFCALIGFSPYLWLVFRADKVYPSWGGHSPFSTALLQWKSLWENHWTQDGPSMNFLVARMGWIAAGILFVSVFCLLGFGLFVKGDRRSLTSGIGFWAWIFSGLGGIFFASNSTETLGPTFLWFLAEGSFFFILGVDKVLGSLTRHSNRSVESVLGAVVLFSGIFVGAFWEGQGNWRKDFYFPSQHAENLLRVMGTRSLLICRDPFQYWACLASQGSLGLVPHSLVLKEDYLGQKWFAVETMEKEPEVLFSQGRGGREGILASFIKDNQAQWEVLLDQPFPLGTAGGLKSYSMGLARLFVRDSPNDRKPEDTQARFDLIGLPSVDEAKDPFMLHYLEAYVEGFNQMGLGYMEQGRYSQAIHSFDRALKLDPGFKAAQDHLAWLYSQKNMLEAAQLDFEATLKTHPAQIADLMEQLESSKSLGHEAETVELLDRIIQLNAELANSQYQLSRIYDKEGRPADARVLLEASVALNPKQIESQLSLGRLMRKMGDELRAREAFHEALVLDPLNKEAQLEYWKSLNDR